MPTQKTYDQLPYDARRCPGCNHTKGNKKDSCGVYTCEGCSGIFAHNIYVGDSYTYVLPYFDPNAATIPPEQWRYYDLTCLGSEGVVRRHGWYFPPTKKVCQVG